jgi:hypothetical protein
MAATHADGRLLIFLAFQLTGDAGVESAGAMAFHPNQNPSCLDFDTL